MTDKIVISFDRKVIEFDRIAGTFRDSEHCLSAFPSLTVPSRYRNPRYESTTLRLVVAIFFKKHSSLVWNGLGSMGSVVYDLIQETDLDAAIAIEHAGAY